MSSRASPRAPNRDLTREYKAFDESLKKILRSFESCKEWTDLIAFLSRLLKCMEQYVPVLRRLLHKQAVCKRLAQCLNPELPYGVHLKTLEVYDVIFSDVEQERLVQDIHLYGLGLFPAFAGATITVRSALLTFYRQRMLPLASSLTNVLPGLIPAMLPGLEEGSEHMNETTQLLSDICAVTGVGKVVTTLWNVISDGMQYRLQALDFINLLLTSPTMAKRAGIGFTTLPSQFQEEPEGELVESGHDAETTGGEGRAFDRTMGMALLAAKGHSIPACISGLLAGLEDSQILIQRVALDVTSRLIDLTKEEQAFREEHIVRAVAASLEVLQRLNSGLTRRLYAWWLNNVNGGGMDGPGFETIPDITKRRIVSGIIRVLKKPLWDMGLEKPFEVERAALESTTSKAAAKHIQRTAKALVLVFSRHDAVIAFMPSFLREVFMTILQGSELVANAQEGEGSAAGQISVLRAQEVSKLVDLMLINVQKLIEGTDATMVWSVLTEIWEDRQFDTLALLNLLISSEFIMPEYYADDGAVIFLEQLFKYVKQILEQEGSAFDMIHSDTMLSAIFAVCNEIFHNIVCITAGLKLKERKHRQRSQSPAFSDTDNIRMSPMQETSEQAHPQVMMKRSGSFFHEEMMAYEEVKSILYDGPPDRGWTAHGLIARQQGRLLELILMYCGFAQRLFDSRLQLFESQEAQFWYTGEDFDMVARPFFTLAAKVNALWYILEKCDAIQSQTFVSKTQWNASAGWVDAVTNFIIKYAKPTFTSDLLTPEDACDVFRESAEDTRETHIVVLSTIRFLINLMTINSELPVTASVDGDVECPFGARLYQRIHVHGRLNLIMAGFLWRLLCPDLRPNINNGSPARYLALLNDLSDSREPEMIIGRVLNCGTGLKSTISVLEESGNGRVFVEDLNTVVGRAIETYGMFFKLTKGIVVYPSFARPTLLMLDLLTSGSAGGMNSDMNQRLLVVIEDMILVQTTALQVNARVHGEDDATLQFARLMDPLMSILLEPSNIGINRANSPNEATLGSARPVLYSERRIHAALKILLLFMRQRLDLIAMMTLLTPVTGVYIEVLAQGQLDILRIVNAAGSGARQKLSDTSDRKVQQELSIAAQHSLQLKSPCRTMFDVIVLATVLIVQAEAPMRRNQSASDLAHELIDYSSTRLLALEVLAECMAGIALCIQRQSDSQDMRHMRVIKSLTNSAIYNNRVAFLRYYVVLLQDVILSTDKTRTDADMARAHNNHAQYFADVLIKSIFMIIGLPYTNLEEHSGRSTQLAEPSHGEKSSHDDLQGSRISMTSPHFNHLRTAGTSVQSLADVFASGVDCYEASHAILQAVRQFVIENRRGSTVSVVTMWLQHASSLPRVLPTGPALDAYHRCFQLVCDGLQTVRSDLMAHTQSLKNEIRIFDSLREQQRRSLARQSQRKAATPLPVGSELPPRLTETACFKELPMPLVTMNVLQELMNMLRTMLEAGMVASDIDEIKAWEIVRQKQMMGSRDGHSFSLDNGGLLGRGRVIDDADLVAGKTTDTDTSDGKGFFGNLFGSKSAEEKDARAKSHSVPQDDNHGALPEHALTQPNVGDSNLSIWYTVRSTVLQWRRNESRMDTQQLAKAGSHWILPVLDRTCAMWEHCEELCTSLQNKAGKAIARNRSMPQTPMPARLRRRSGTTDHLLSTGGDRTLLHTEESDSKLLAALNQEDLLLYGRSRAVQKQAIEILARVFWLDRHRCVATVLQLLDFFDTPQLLSELAKEHIFAMNTGKSAKVEDKADTAQSKLRHVMLRMLLGSKICDLSTLIRTIRELILNMRSGKTSVPIAPNDEQADPMVKEETAMTSPKTRKASTAADPRGSVRASEQGKVARSREAIATAFKQQQHAATATSVLYTVFSSTEASLLPISDRVRLEVSAIRLVEDAVQWFLIQRRQTWQLLGSSARPSARGAAKNDSLPLSKAEYVDLQGMICSFVSEVQVSADSIMGVGSAYGSAAKKDTSAERMRQSAIKRLQQGMAELMAATASSTSTVDRSADLRRITASLGVHSGIAKFLNCTEVNVGLVGLCHTWVEEAFRIGHGVSDLQRTTSSRPGFGAMDDDQSTANSHSGLNPSTTAGNTVLDTVVSKEQVVASENRMRSTLWALMDGLRESLMQGLPWCGESTASLVELSANWRQRVQEAAVPSTDSAVQRKSGSATGSDPVNVDKKRIKRYVREKDGTVREVMEHSGEQPKDGRPKDTSTNVVADHQSVVERQRYALFEKGLLHAPTQGSNALPCGVTRLVLQCILAGIMSRSVGAQAFNDLDLLYSGVSVKEREAFSSNIAAYLPLVEQSLTMSHALSPTQYAANLAETAERLSEGDIVVSFPSVLPALVEADEGSAAHGATTGNAAAAAPVLHCTEQSAACDVAQRLRYFNDPAVPPKPMVSGALSLLASLIDLRFGVRVTKPLISELFLSSPALGTLAVQNFPSSKILIDRTLQSDRTIFGEQVLAKVPISVQVGGAVGSAVANLFVPGASKGSSEAAAFEQIRHWRRLSMALLASEMDTYVKELPSILEKVSDVLKAVTEHLLKREVFLLLRVMLLRFSAGNQGNIWSLLVIELIRALQYAEGRFNQIVHDDNHQTVPSSSTNGTAQIMHERADAEPVVRSGCLASTCKALGMLVLMRPEAFLLHEWIFRDAAFMHHDLAGVSRGSGQDNGSNAASKHISVKSSKPRYPEYVPVGHVFTNLIDVMGAASGKERHYLGLTSSEFTLDAPADPSVTEEGISHDTRTALLGCDLDVQTLHFAPFFRALARSVGSSSDTNSAGAIDAQPSQSSTMRYRRLLEASVREDVCRTAGAFAFSSV
eukprot:Clim_evm14s33 gene=Clim_evmTU14s33